MGKAGPRVSRSMRHVRQACCGSVGALICLPAPRRPCLCLPAGTSTSHPESVSGKPLDGAEIRTAHAPLPLVLQVRGASLPLSGSSGGGRRLACSKARSKGPGLGFNPAAAARQASES